VATERGMHSGMPVWSIRAPGNIFLGMAKSYRECPTCGKRALRIATRCPRCGQDLPTQSVRRQASRNTSRLLPIAPLAVILLVAVGLFTLVKQRSMARGRDARVTATARAEAPVALDSARAAASPALPDSAPSPEAVPRQARTWTKVHDRRSAKADVVAVLLPGDTVLTDSLVGGWWRVALEGRVIGYVYAATLVGD
jgi:hypothetical protein